MQRTTVLMEVDAKLAYVLNNQVAIETMTRLNYDKNTDPSLTNRLLRKFLL